MAEGGGYYAREADLANINDKKAANEKEEAEGTSIGAVTDSIRSQ